MLSIQTLGGLNVKRGGKTLPLPPSKKTRALLAYLLLTTRPHRRDRLCELFWQVPDDPRGALRWSLSKLRNVVNEPDNTRLIADRERVEIATDDIDIDVRAIEELLEQKQLTAEKLCSIASQLNETLFEGIDLPNYQAFQNWLTSERNNTARLYSLVVKRLAKCGDISQEDRSHWTQVWLEANPSSTKAELDLPSKLSNNLDDHPSDHLTRQLLKRQKIQFCETSDNVRIAYGTVGEGSPLVKAANWLSHLELDWDAPIWSPLFRELAQDHRFIRYDERGNGLSDWDVTDISFEAFVKDLETLVDALKLEKFPLLGISQGAAVSIEYAIRHPKRVSHLILFGAYASGWRINATPEVIKEREAVMTLTQTGWGQDNPAYRQIFSSTFMPSASAEELNWFNEFQRQTTSPENAVRFQSAFGDIDVRDQLAKVSVPTLVIHSVGDRRIPISHGREIAASIPNAEFVCLDSDNHLLIGQEPASKAFVDAVRNFIG